MTTNKFNAVTFAASILAFLALLTGAPGLKIKNLVVPQVVRNGSESAIILDCDYTLDEGDNVGLVVKWFFNSNLVYQWIPDKQPQDLNILRSRLNLDYKASEDASKMYRALQIVNPTTELSGEYKCLVSCFESEESQSKKMVIYVPERSMQLVQEKPSPSTRAVKCTAEGIYPQPNMTISSKEQIEGSKVDIETTNRNGLFDISAQMTFDDRVVVESVTFDCVLRIPDANYTVQRSVVYLPETKELVPFDGNSNGAHLLRPGLFIILVVFLHLRL